MTHDPRTLDGHLLMGGGGRSGSKLHTAFSILFACILSS